MLLDKLDKAVAGCDVVGLNVSGEGSLKECLGGLTERDSRFLRTDC